MQYAKKISAKYGIMPKKRFGQNFLIDEGVISNIVKYAAARGKAILEIGPGTGNLTKELLHSGALKVIAVERDNECIMALQDLKVIYQNLELIHDNALSIDEEHLAGIYGKISIVANLPYNIGTALLIKWIKKINLFDSILIMLQKEVVDRIVAPPRTKDYGSLSVMVQLLCSAEKLFDVKPEAFWPPPKITSSVLLLRKLPMPLVNCEISALEPFLQTIFAQKRKTLRNNLKKILQNKTTDVLAQHNITESTRAEELTVQQIYMLAIHCNQYLKNGIANLV